MKQYVILGGEWEIEDGKQCHILYVENDDMTGIMMPLMAIMIIMTVSLWLLPELCKNSKKTEMEKAGRTGG